MKTRVLVSKTDTIFSNLAFEEYLIEHANPAPTLFLWRNKPTVTIGRHQNPWKECNLSLMESSGISLARRYSGGGAVFQDLGCTTFTFLNRIDTAESAKSLIDSNFEMVCRALSSLGVSSAVRQGRNDIVCDGRKVSGSAFKQNPNYVLHHGTILVNTDMGALSRLLTPDKLKLQSKGISSVSARVANLSDLNPSVSHEVVCDAISQTFLSHYRSVDQAIEYIDNDSSSLQSPEYLSHFDKLKDWNWRFGSTPEFSHSFSNRIDGLGCFDLHLNVSNAKITNCRLFSDCLDTSIVSNTVASLKGCTYKLDSIDAAMRNNPLREWVTFEIGQAM